MWWTGDLSRVYPASRPITAGIGSSPPCDPTVGLSGYGKWMDGWKPDKISSSTYSLTSHTYTLAFTHTLIAPLDLSSAPLHLLNFLHLKWFSVWHILNFSASITWCEPLGSDSARPVQCFCKTKKVVFSPKVISWPSRKWGYVSFLSLSSSVPKLWWTPVLWIPIKLTDRNVILGQLLMYSDNQSCS